MDSSTQEIEQESVMKREKRRLSSEANHFNGWQFTEMFKYESEEETSIIGMREDYTYGTKKDASREKIEELTNLCKELIEKTKNIIFNN